MECRRCATPLEKPGDFCLVCREANADTIVLEAARDRATITMLYEENVAGETTITTIPEDGENEVVELRNFAGKIGDEIRRKRPDEVYATGDRTIVRSVRDDVHYSFYRVDGDDPVEQVLQNRGERALDVVDEHPVEKIGGSHTTLIGGRTGMRAIQTVAGHPHVKKVIPGPIDAGGKGSQSGLRAKVTRADGGGNLRMLLRDGSSVQENRIVTTARDREMGERVREDLNEALEDEDLR
ncbi:DUF2103 domain-containing protein [Halobacteria archaeon AArc-m2/3/4]|uniref:DUF2103 domain-containing protein n=1 Tax=Natronoglomus mannanivorans TaxID=2979990 RepID=A0AAP2YVB7_9EURY|nr:DUF2103 domain-containing protein [Halobacteria archaeon AArc-xg1-1]MCU4971727.1 DUF2103 domain-containing protein [Halobacteria archaeon AArc-m2/3/4]